MIRSGWMPSFIQKIDKREMPAMAREAKNRSPVIGSDPLRHAVFAKGCREDGLHLLRIRLLRAMTTQQITAVRIGHRQRLIRSPFPVRNQPLKSPHHVWLAASTFSNGLLYTGIFHRFLCCCALEPSRRKISPKSAHHRPIDTLFRHQKTRPAASSLPNLARAPFRTTICSSIPLLV